MNMENQQPTGMAASAGCAQAYQEKLQEMERALALLAAEKLQAMERALALLAAEQDRNAFFERNKNAIEGLTHLFASRAGMSDEVTAQIAHGLGAGRAVF
jgi:hypothetical protein